MQSQTETIFLFITKIGWKEAILMNEKEIEMTGYSERELIGQSARILYESDGKLSIRSLNTSLAPSDVSDR